MLRVVPGMPLPVVNHHLAEIERREAFEAGNVDAKLMRIRAALVMGVDAADRAEMMLGRPGIEAVGRELVLTLR